MKTILILTLLSLPIMLPGQQCGCPDNSTNCVSFPASCNLCGLATCNSNPDPVMSTDNFNSCRSKVNYRELCM